MREHSVRLPLPAHVTRLTAYVVAVASGEDLPWSRRFSGMVGQQVQWWRRRRKLTTQQLADRCEELGHRVETNVIANMESGRRANVPVAEVPVLAAALDVPPIVLIWPARTDALVEPLPGVTDVRSWPAAVRWFTGEGPPPLDQVDGKAWVEATETLDFLRSQEEELRKCRAAHRELTAAERELGAATSDDDRDRLGARVERAERRVREAERALASRRGHMRSLGIEPGPLESSLTHADELPEARA